MIERVRRHALLPALAGAVTAAAVWYVLATTTGLIFHLMPAAPTLAAAWMLRWSGHGRPIGTRIAVVVTGMSISLAVTLLLVRDGRPLDEPALTGLAIVAGAVLGGWLLRSGDALTAA